MPKKILLADDSITIQKVVELTFSDGDYEVTAVNNGAKAIAKLGEMRPDIILSDIIMPEKNGYEVCEYVKSHPEFRNLPVVLLTGTFEPFDPDRAEKAGCDAVVTKPFESQSLIHKVEELIAQSRANTAAAAPAPAPEPEAASPWADDTANVPPPADSPFGGGSFTPAPEPFTHGGDIFGAAPAPSGATTEMPFDTPPAAPEYSGETRAFPKLNFDDFQEPPAAAPEPPAAPPSTPEPSPWDEQPAYSGETRAFQKMSFDDFQPPAGPPTVEPPIEAESPFGAPPPAEEFSGETRAFPRMSFDDLQRMAGESAAPPPPPAAPSYEPPAPEPSPWDEQPPAPPAAATPEPSPWDEQPAFGGGETRAFPKMSFDDFQQMAPPPAPEPQPEPQVTPEPSPWDEPAAPEYSGETRAFPKMSFDEMQALVSPQSTPAPEPPAPAEPEAAPWEEPAPPAWSPAAETSSPTTESFSTEAASPFAESLSEPASAPSYEPEPEPEPEQPAEPAWSPAPVAAAAPSTPEPTIPIARGGDLTDEQIDKIARRVVELMSDQVVRNIAWEVIPDLAEMCVKERIRQLEAEA